MKRLLCLFLCVLLPVAALASCGSKYPISLPELNEKPGLSMEIVTMGSTGFQKTVTVRLTNGTEHTILYGMTYQLLRYDGASWENATSTPSLGNRAYHPDAYVLKSGESREVTFTLTSRYFVNRSTPYCLTMRFFEEKGKEEYGCAVLLEPGAWQ